MHYFLVSSKVSKLIFGINSIFFSDRERCFNFGGTTFGNLYGFFRPILTIGSRILNLTHNVLRMKIALAIKSTPLHKSELHFNDDVTNHSVENFAEDNVTFV